MTLKHVAIEAVAVVPDVLMLRHCESDGFTADAPLTPLGYQQATRLAERLAQMPIDYVVSSPYRRALESIAPLAQSRGLAVHTDARLEERRRNRDNTPITNWNEWVRRSFDDLDFRSPGGESGRDVARRGARVLCETLSSNHELPLLSTHGQLMSFLANSIDSDFGYERAGLMAYPALMRFRRADGVVTFETLL